MLADGNAAQEGDGREGRAHQLSAEGTLTASAVLGEGLQDRAAPGQAESGKGTASQSHGRGPFLKFSSQDSAPALDLVKQHLASQGAFLQEAC